LTSLLVASTGGHLTELVILRDRLSLPSAAVRWITFDTPQSRSLLEGADVIYAPFVGGRDPINLVRNLPLAVQVLRDPEIRLVVSTGSSMALPYFLAARLRGLTCCYIESAARTEGPSVTGGLMARIPGVALHTQYPNWTSQRWMYSGSVFDAFAPTAPAAPVETLAKVVVTLGTYRGYSFRRLLERLVAVLPPEAEVLWQTGDTDTSGLPISSHVELPSSYLKAAMADADLVVAHAGIGTMLAAFETGKAPLLVPRRAAFHEHVDDHQIQIAEHLASRGLVVTTDADDIGLPLLLQAATRRVARVHPPDFRLNLGADVVGR
jgi:UDP-N-acetylglucosamine--N-acetylmuramyl-(pentapeptide) pyrophosphoryl-undecaprenol N-acetylglucosamine transferase